MANPVLTAVTASALCLLWLSMVDNLKGVQNPQQKEKDYRSMTNEADRLAAHARMLEDWGFPGERMNIMSDLARTGTFTPVEIARITDARLGNADWKIERRIEIPGEQSDIAGEMESVEAWKESSSRVLEAQRPENESHDEEVKRIGEHQRKFSNLLSDHPGLADLFDQRPPNRMNRIQR